MSAVPADPYILGREARPEVVKTSRGPVECASFGEGPAVLSLHGAMGGWDQSVLLARTLGAPNFRYVAVSRPGYLGTSLRLGKTPAEQGDLLADLLDALGLREAAVMAVSGGGPQALGFALRHPERCWGLVMASAASARVDVPVPFAWQVIKLAARARFLGNLMRRRLEKDPDGAARASIPDDALRARTLADPEAGSLMRALQASTFERMAERIAGTDNDIAQTRVDLGLQLDQLTTPLLVIHGTNDRMAPYAHSKALAERVRGAELLAVEGGEHVSIFTHRAEAKARVGAFLAAHSPAARVASA